MRFIGSRIAIASVVALLVGAQAATAREIKHDAEFYILKQQNGEEWAKEDEALDAELAAFRGKNAGKPPNIFYIPIDDIGFGDLGSETLKG